MGARDPLGPNSEPGAERAGERGTLRVNATCVIRLDELEWRTTGSGGPGGQHANTSDTRVEVRFPIATSTSLAPRQRERLLERLGPVARATASDSRSQARNRDLALERLRSRLEQALHVHPPTKNPPCGPDTDYNCFPGVTFGDGTVWAVDNTRHEVLRVAPN